MAQSVVDALYRNLEASAELTEIEIQFLTAAQERWFGVQFDAGVYKIKMIQCEYCWSRNPHDSETCTHCGAPFHFSGSVK
jgi:hypothetical protein